MSPNWKRLDVTQKRVTRGLCSLAKNFFRQCLKTGKNKLLYTFWTVIEEFLQTWFKRLYEERRLEVLGTVGKMVLMKKFNEYMAKTTMFGRKEKTAIRRHANDYFDSKYQCGTVRERHNILHSPPVLIGKMLYDSSEEMRSQFWKKVFDRKNQRINNKALYIQETEEEMKKIRLYGFIDVEKILKSTKK